MDELDLITIRCELVASGILISRAVSPFLPEGDRGRTVAAEHLLRERRDPGFESQGQQVGKVVVEGFEPPSFRERTARLLTTKPNDLIGNVVEYIYHIQLLLVWHPP